jgi:hypothetical protein
MGKVIPIAVVMILIVLCFPGCSAIETRTDIEPLLNHLPDLSIKSACWYGGVKEDRFSGVGPCTYVIYGVAKTDGDFAQEIKEEYEWTNGDTGRIFELLSCLDTKDYLDKEQNYLYSKDFTENKTNTLNSDVSADSENNMINFDILVSFENNTVVFYAELMDF